jgi:flagellar basal-body rod protein FlgB
MADINPLSFGSTLDLLSNAMTGASMEHAAIADNIANAQTPGYKTQTVSFQDALAAAVNGTSSDPGQLPMVADNDRQFGYTDTNGAVPFAPQTVEPGTTSMRTDGNDVDIDQETALMSQNSGYGQTMAELLGTQYTRLREMITEQP